MESQYDQDHQICPNCHAVVDKFDDSILIKRSCWNVCWCVCGWVGLVDDLVSLPSAQKNFEDQYYQNHQCCPECGCDNLETTCVGYLITNDDSRDKNAARCECGWVGIVHDMVPKRNLE
jgi:RNA polymerase subunit RPABC4/transcription elongation factor Spt4